MTLYIVFVIVSALVDMDDKYLMSTNLMFHVMLTLNAPRWHSLAAWQAQLKLWGGVSSHMTGLGSLTVAVSWLSQLNKNLEFPGALHRAGWRLSATKLLLQPVGDEKESAFFSKCPVEKMLNDCM